MYGTNYGSVKVLEESLEPSVASFFRFALASLVFIPNVIKVFGSNPKVITSGFQVGLFNAGGYFAQAMALNTGAEVSNAAFICSMSVIVVPLLNLLPSPGNLKTRASFSQMYPPMLALMGIACLELGGTSGAMGTGDMVAFLCPLMFGYAVCLYSSLTHTHTHTVCLHFSLNIHMPIQYWKNAALVKNCQGPEEILAFAGSAIASVALMSSLWVGVDVIYPAWAYGGIDRVTEICSSQIIHLSDLPVISAIAWTGVYTSYLL